MSKLWFRKYETKEVFTEYIHLLMQNKTPFMILMDNKQIIDNEKDIDEWYSIHGFFDNTPSILGYYTKDRKGNKGYLIRCTNDIITVIIPEDLIALSYEEFLREIEK